VTLFIIIYSLSTLWICKLVDLAFDKKEERYRTFQQQNILFLLALNYRKQIIMFNNKFNNN